MGRRREYIKNLDVAKNDIQIMEYAQDDVYDFISGRKSREQLIQALGPASTILGLIFMQYTAAGVAAAIVGVLSGMTNTEKDSLKAVINNGSRGLRDVKRIMDRSNLNIERVRVDFPFLEFIDDRLSVVQGGGLIKAYLVNGSWMYLE